MHVLGRHLGLRYSKSILSEPLDLSFYDIQNELSNDRDEFKVLHSPHQPLFGGGWQNPQVCWEKFL